VADDAAANHSLPRLRAGENDRPTPLRQNADEPLRFLLLLLASLFLHTAIFALSRAEPELMASVGEDAITVEIIVGTESAAGTAQAKSDVETEQQPAADTRQDETTQETTSKEQKPLRPEPKLTFREEALAPDRKDVSPTDRNAEEPLREPQPPERSRPNPTPSAPTAPAATSIGRGRMTAGDANYQGLVAARLARFKRFPPDARRRREQGSALVSFVIDATGHVTSVHLARGSGFAALDEEVQAMVRRASPFPPPPRGAEMTFSAPVSFRLN
jgi:TonB family protein